MNLFIPSKNRVDNSHLLSFLSQIDTKQIVVVVEPSEILKYRNKYPMFNYLILPIDNGGITYVRNYIKEHTENSGISNYWQLDDDITGLFYRVGTKLIRSDLNVLLQAQQKFIENNIALGALEYRQFAWSATKELIANSFCDTCVFVDNKLTDGLRYRVYVEGKEDRDFAMQVIKNGLKTARNTMFAFSAPPNGSNAGGLKEIFYDLGKEEICVSRMVELWGDDICQPITKENGRKDVKIYWNKINLNQTSLF